MSDKPKITDEDLKKGAENLSKVSDEEKARIDKKVYEKQR